MIRRRQLLQSLGVGWLADQVLPDRGGIEGELLGASHRVGHLLRDGHVAPTSGPPEEVEVAVVGAGVSGLMCAWRLAKAGVGAHLLELEPRPGGTSAWGDDGVVPHPWGAHYLPVPEPHARPVSRLLEELGVIQGWDGAGRPLLRAEMLCHSPEERLFYRGQWHGGLVPLEALGARERGELERFRAIKEELSEARGSDGRPAFTIPFAHCSRDPRFRQLDQLSMAQWLDRQGFATDFLRWFVEYGTLDDFGAGLEDVSAWAGLHYFSARKLDSEQLSGSRYLVWPEGNGWLVKQLLARLPHPVRTGALALALEPQRDRVIVHYLDVASHTVRRLSARAAVLATPAFIARRLLSGVLSPRTASRLPERAASPWMVANLHVRRPVEPSRTWDSVIYQSPGLGYVDASHQLTSLSERTVLTYFRAFGAADVVATRNDLVAQSWASLASAVLRDLGGVHPELVDQTDRIDVMTWGHAMPRPRPGFIAHEGLEPAVLLADRVAWAHVDQTGYALFEEAADHGVRAAETVIEALGAPAGETFL